MGKPFLNNRIVGIIVICVIATTQVVGQGMHPLAQIKKVKAEIKSGNKTYLAAYQQLLEMADSALLKPNNALNDFNVPGRYIDSTLHKKNSQSLQIDAFNAYCCALAFRLSGKSVYGKKACELLNAWGSINKKYSNNDGSLVMAYSGAGLLNAAILMQQESLWGKKDQLQFKEWVKNVYDKSALEIRNRKNNWADWGRYASLLSSVFVGDTAELNTNIQLIKSDIALKIAADGSMPEETKRGDNGIWYTYFSLAPITASAWVIYNATGEDLFHEEIQHASLKKALDYLLTYSKSPDSWPHFPHPHPPATKGNLAGWPANLFEAMGDIYQDAPMKEYAKKYTPIIYSRHHFAWTFPTLMPSLLGGY